MEVVDYVLLSEQWCCVEKSVKGMASKVELAEIAVLQCAAFPVLNANMQITLELTNKYKKFFQFTSQLSQISISTFLYNR